MTQTLNFAIEELEELEAPNFWNAFNVGAVITASFIAGFTLT